MAGLFFNNPETPEGKYLVQRRDGSVPEWPHFVLAASDQAAPEALRQYAIQCQKLGYDSKYCEEVYQLAYEFEKWRHIHGPGDPDAPRHRKDDPEIIRKMRMGGSA